MEQIARDYHRTINQRIVKLYQLHVQRNIQNTKQLAGRRAEGLADARRVEEEGHEGPGTEEDMAAVEEVLERRRARGGYEALVAWAGTDPETGEAWPQSWVPEAWLSADLRRKRVRLPARRESVEERRSRLVEDQQRVARRKRVEEARRLGEVAGRDRRASNRGARARVRKGVVVGSPGEGARKEQETRSTEVDSGNAPQQP